MTQNDNFAELQELREQYKLLEKKIERQESINEELIRTIMKEKMLWVKNSRKSYFISSICIIPIAISFIILHFPWEYIAFVIIFAVLSFYLNFKAFGVLKIDELFNLSMSEASNSLIKYKKMRIKNVKINFIPIVVVYIWTYFVVTGHELNIDSIIPVITGLVGAMCGGIIIERKRLKKLDETLKQIEELHKN